MPRSTASDTTDDLSDVLDSEQFTDEHLQKIKKKSVSGAVSYFARTAVLQGIGLISAFILSAFLSPEDFGIYGFVVQIIGLLIFFSDVGLAAALIQKKTSPSKTDYRTAFTIQQLLSWLIVLLVMILLSTGIVQQKTGVVGVWVLLALAVSFPLATLKTIPSIILERKLDFSKLVIPQIFEQITFHGLLIVLAWQGYGVMSYAYAIIARSLVGAFSMTVIQPWPFGVALNKGSIRSLLGYGLKFQANDLLARIKDQLFYLFLGWFMPLHQFGYVQWAKNWSVYPYNLTVQNVLAITFPTFSRLQKNKTALKKAIEKSLFFITLTIFPILVGMSVFIWPLVDLVTQYQKWEPALWSLVFFSLSIGWGAISTPLTNTLNAIGHINTTLKLMVLWTVLTWVITPLFMWLFGFQGVALSAFAISFTSVLPIYFVKKQVLIDAWEQVWRQLISVGVMAVVGVAGLSLWNQSFVWLLAGMAITGMTYWVTMALVGYSKLKSEILSLVK